jgi:ribosome-associated protein
LQKEAKKSEEMKEVVLNALEDMKAKDVSIIDVKGRTSVTDYMIIASATSSRHVSSVAENLVTEIKKHGGRSLGVEGGEGSDWLLVDLGDIVVHIMMPSAREYYDLERFWKTSPLADGNEAYS